MEDRRSATSELSELSAIIRTHIQTSKIIQENQEKLLNKHSDELWGAGGEPGLAKEMDRVKTAVGFGKWLAGITGILSLDRIVAFLSQLKH